MKILITGFSGFVSRHFLAYIEQAGVDAEVLGIGRSRPNFLFEDFRHLRCRFQQFDLLDKGGLEEAVYMFRPTHILHLAAFSSVGFSWQKPVDSFANNTNVFLNLIEQVRTLGLQCRILSVGSSEEYGDLETASLPLVEETPLRPVSPYAVARVAQEMLSKVYVRGYGMDIVMTRSFNHIGPHQRDAFVVPSLAKQLTAIRYKGSEPKLVTGDRSIVRDFVDVRDVAAAYWKLLAKGRAGEAYNICSGRGRSIDDVIGVMQERLGCCATLETDARLVRPSDNRAVIGSNEKIRRELGWEPQISFEQSIEDILAWWKTQ